jgi:hypothetical protein
MTKNETRIKDMEKETTFANSNLKNKKNIMKSTLSKFSILIAVLFSFGFFGCKNANTSSNPSASDTTTRVQIVNKTDSAITVYITLGTTTGCLQHVSLIPYVTDSIGNLVGSFSLGAHDSTVAWAPSSIGFNGNVTFGTQPINCPNAQYPNGTNIFEFIVNNSFQSGIPQNTVDISCVSGVNCFIKGYLTGGNPWNASSAYPNVDSIYNATITSNSGLVGIFPFGCDTCTGRKNPPSCDTVSSDKQTQSICTVQRNAVGSGGGLIQVVYFGIGEQICMAKK